jgi:natural resistance-associated macrophage protein
MAICFFVNFIVVKPDIPSVLYGTFIPTVPSGCTTQAIGLIGAVIMPHNLHLHSSLVLSRKINNESKHAVHEANIYNAIESAVSLFISFLISFAVVGTFAFYHDSGLADDLNLRNADQALEKSFGSGAKIIWAVGLLAAGQSSTMTGTYAG